MTSDMMLLLHGTEASKLTAQAILQAAQADLRRKDRNRKLKAERDRLRVAGSQLSGLGTTEPYAFLSSHVKSATSTPELIRLALESRAAIMAFVESWESFQRTIPKEKRKPCKYKPDTIRIYRDAELLGEAFALASQTVTA